MPEVSSECLGHFWRAEVGQFWRAPKAHSRCDAGTFNKISSFHAVILRSGLYLMPVHAAASEHSDGLETGKNLIGQRETSSNRVAMPKIGTAQDLGKAAERVDASRHSGPKERNDENSRRGQLRPAGAPGSCPSSGWLRVPDRWRRNESRTAPRITAASSPRMAPDISAYRGRTDPGLIGIVQRDAWHL